MLNFLMTALCLLTCVLLLSEWIWAVMLKLQTRKKKNHHLLMTQAVHRTQQSSKLILRKKITKKIPTLVNLLAHHLTKNIKQRNRASLRKDREIRAKISKLKR